MTFQGVFMLCRTCQNTNFSATNNYRYAFNGKEHDSDGELGSLTHLSDSEIPQQAGMIRVSVAHRSGGSSAISNLTSTFCKVTLLNFVKMNNTKTYCHYVSSNISNSTGLRYNFSFPNFSDVKNPFFSSMFK